MKKIFFIAASAALFTACGNSNNDYDATGTFEATEVTVSAEQNGRLMFLNIEEGDLVEAGKQIGLIDTVQLYLRACQIGTTKTVYAAQKPEIEKQIAATREQLSKAKTEFERYSRLVKDGAANQKQLDDAESQMKVFEKQLAAQLSSLYNSTNSLDAQMTTTDAEKLLVLDQLDKCHISSPITGTILEKYAEEGEYATIGKPVFKVADIHEMYLRAYVTTSQLQNVKLGQSAKVYADYGDGDRMEYEGTVTWISSKSEFTPKTILTDDERADLVYAVKLLVKNDGYIKIGMYGEVKF